MAATLLVLAFLLGETPSGAASQADAMFDVAQVQVCATADREAARVCVDKVLRPETKRRLLATPFQDLHQLGVLEGAPVVSRFSQLWPEGVRQALSEKLAADGYVLAQNDPIYVVLQDYWLVQNGCDLDDQARIEDDKRAAAYLEDAIRDAMKAHRGVTVIRPPHTFRPNCKPTTGATPS